MNIWTDGEYRYTYDEGGNIVTETIDGTVHTYDSVWKDKLIAYDGKSITYDVFGCPSDYMGSAILHPDLEHPAPEGPHWDYIPYKNGPQYRVMPDGIVVPK